MKRFLFAVLAVVLCFSLCACGGVSGPEGTYKDVLTGIVEITFDGDNITVTAGGVSAMGTYTLEENVIKIEIEGAEGFNYDTLTYDVENDTLGYGGITVFQKAE